MGMGMGWESRHNDNSLLMEIWRLVTCGYGLHRSSITELSFCLQYLNVVGQYIVQNPYPARLLLHQFSVLEITYVDLDTPKENVWRKFFYKPNVIAAMQAN